MTRGRPSFRPTKAQRFRCTVLAAARMSEADIARVFGIAIMTLRKHFADELTVGVAKRNAEIYEAMFKTGKAGNVAAQRAWLARQDVMPEAPAEAKAPKLGKKGEQEADAMAPPPAEWGVLVKH